MQVPEIPQKPIIQGSGSESQQYNNTQTDNNESIWLKDDGDGKFNREDIVDENLRNDDIFWNKIKDLEGKPLNEITKKLLDILYSLYNLNKGPDASFEPTKKTKDSNHKQNMTEGTELGRKLKYYCEKSDVKNVKEIFKQITPENVTYVVGSMSDIAEVIDEVFDWGNGFDKSDVHKEIVSKLVKRAYDLGLHEEIETARKQPWAKPFPDMLSEDCSLEELKNAIHVLSVVINDKENN